MSEKAAAPKNAGARIKKEGIHNGLGHSDPSTTPTYHQIETMNCVG
jgi:hypothetical protein